MNLVQDTVLQCASDLDLRIDSSNQVRIIIGGNCLSCSSHGLLVLNAFATPRPFGEALAELRNTVVGMQDWIDLTSVLGQLYQAGVLRAQDTRADRKPDIVAYSSVEDTLAIYGDFEHLAHLLAAIAKTVRPDDIVIDLNGAPGICAIASARAGASRTYSLEGGSLTSLVQTALAANRVADRIILASSLPALEDLPALADVLIGNITCSDILFGDMLHTNIHLQRRLLKEDARILPERVELMALPVTIPIAELRSRTFTPDVVENWEAWYGIDFTPFVEVAAHSALLYQLRLYTAHDWPVLADPIALVETGPIELDTLPQNVTVPFRASAAGLLNGVVLYLDIQYCPVISDSTHPAQLAPHSSSQGFYWVFDQPIEVQPGEQLVLSYGRAALSNDPWISVSRIEKGNDASSKRKP